VRPVFGTVYLTIAALVAAPSGPARDELLGDLIEGRRSAAVAVADRAGQFGPNLLTVTVLRRHRHRDSRARRRRWRGDVLLHEGCEPRLKREATWFAATNATQNQCSAEYFGDRLCCRDFQGEVTAVCAEGRATRGALRPNCSNPRCFGQLRSMG
jgi:hypothetical protein